MAKLTQNSSIANYHGWLLIDVFLEEAQDPRTPLTERAKFLAIVSSNLDEFCMVRYAEVRRNRNLSNPDPAGLSPKEQYHDLASGIHALVKDQYACLNKDVLPQLAENGLQIIDRDAWTDDDRQQLRTQFQRDIEPILTPQAVDPAHPFPLIGNQSIHLALRLSGSKGTKGSKNGKNRSRYALVGVPSSVPRLLELPDQRFAQLTDVVIEHLGRLFPGSSIDAAVAFRIARDGALEIDEDHATDLLSEIEASLRQRALGDPVRMEIRANYDEDLYTWLCEHLGLEEEDITIIDGPHDLTFLFGVAGFVSNLGRSQFVDQPFQPAPCPVSFTDPFAAIREKAILLHHPYDSFQPVIDMINAAADDPQVLAIKQTLYRVSGDSPIIAALIRAAEAGKQVTVLLELKARFDEENNIQWARQLERAGAHVMYGVIGYKVHAKLLLIVRRDDDGIRRYAHLGTGNYNDKTAKLYEDFSYFTANEAITRDAGNLFNMLTGFSKPPHWERLIVAPLTFRSSIEAAIDRETEHARVGRGGRIIAKMNSLVDTELCEHLYTASQAGVEIDLIVRGICILRPGVPGLSPTIRVRSVIGRYLEHSRLYYFANDGQGEYIIGSGDWMTRNLDRRVESLVSVTEPVFQTFFDNLFTSYLKDKRSSRLLDGNGLSHHQGLTKNAGLSVQDKLMNERRRSRKARSDAARSPDSFSPATRPQ